MLNAGDIFSERPHHQGVECTVWAGGAAAGGAPGPGAHPGVPPL